MSNENLSVLPSIRKTSSLMHAGSKMSRRFLKGTVATIAAGVMLVSGMSVPANAALSQTGPVDPSHGFPAWYADQTGLKLELCLEGPLCLAARPDPTQPTQFPSNFADEAFWWAADASIDTATTSASLVMAQEAAFTNGVAEAGEQNAFSRIRIRVDGLTAGSGYTITHPYGTLNLTADATGVINYTDDFGCFDTPCSQASYDRALNGPVNGPFLVWTEGAPAGYIGDPEVEHAVTGSPTGNNFFRVDGPNVGGANVNSIQTNLFSLQGKLAGPFKDVATTDQFSSEIAWLSQSGITTGFPDGTFRPMTSVSRAAMAAFLYRFSGSPAVDVPAVSPFSDVPTTHQFYREIIWLKNTGITTGFTPTTFAPEMAVNRKDMAAFLFRFNGAPAGYVPPATSPFSDVPTTHQFYREIMWLRDSGITTGFTPTSYAPLMDVNRKDMAAFLFRYNNEFNAGA